MSEYELSYLIRMGAGKHPQATGCFYKDAEGGRLDWATPDEFDQERVAATCAKGAAAVALMSLTTLPIARATVLVDRAAPESVVLLNDAQRLSREAIADWLDARPGGSPIVIA